MFTPAAMPTHHDHEAIPWTDLGSGVRRKPIHETTDASAVLWRYEGPAVGTARTHPVAGQVAFVVAGAFAVDVAGSRRMLRPGDAFMVPAEAAHRVVPLVDGSTLLDQCTGPSPSSGKL